MRRSIIVPAALLLLSGLATGCAHTGTEGAGVASPDRAPLVSANEGAGEASEDEYWADAGSAGPASSDPNVISFEDEAGPVDVVAAPPKREDIPGFQLFGTGDTESDPGPKLTLPEDME